MSELIYTISDTHLSNRKAFGKDLINGEFSGTNSRFNIIIEAIRTCAQQAITAGAEVLILPGDIFNERGILPVAVYNAAYKVFQEISKKISIIFTPGNHDFVSSVTLGSNEGLHSLYGFKEFSSVAHTPQVYETDSFSLSMIPFIPSKELTIDASKQLYKESRKHKGKFKLIFYHHSFDGAETGPINWRMPYELLTSDIPPFDRAFSGHLHKHQRVGEGTGLVYVGAPVQHDAGERNYTPGWLSIDNKGNYTHIENTVSPRFVVIETGSEKEIKKLNPQDYKIIKWTGEEAAGLKLRESYDNIRIEIAPAVNTVLSRSSISTTDSTQEMMKKFIIAKRGKMDEPLFEYGLKAFKDEF